MDTSEKKAICMINVSNELKVSDIKFRSKAIARKITLSSKFALIILTRKRVLMRQSGFISNGQDREAYCFYCSRVTLISTEEGTSLVWRKAPH